MKSNVAEISSPRQPRPAAHVPRAEALAELGLLRKTRIADAMRVALAAEEKVQSAKGAVSQLEREQADATARRDNAQDRETFGAASLDADYIAQKQLPPACAALAEAEAAYAVATRPLVELRQWEQDLIHLHLVAVGEGHIEKFNAAMIEAMRELEATDDILRHFVNRKIPGPYIETISNLRAQAQQFVTALKAPKLYSTHESAELRELIATINRGSN